MDIFTTETISKLLPVIGSILIASLTYYLTKGKEREAELRKEKLNFYIEFISSLTDNLECGDTDGGKRFARASNNLYLFSNTKVIQALKKFQDEIRATNLNRTVEGEAKMLGSLIKHMREDLGIKDKSQNDFDLVNLWGYSKTVKK
jgi:hypothetical protein